METFTIKIVYQITIILFQAVTTLFKSKDTAYDLVLETC